MAGRDKICAACSKAIPAKGRVMECSECSNLFHLGKCSGVSEAAAKGKAEAFFEVWKCGTCYSSRLRGAGGGKEGDEVNIPVILSAILARLEKLEHLPEKVDNIDKSINMMSEKYDEVLKTMARQEAEIKELRKRVVVLESCSNNEEVNHLKVTVNDLEWRSRRQNLVFHGISESDGENLLEKVNDVAHSIELPELCEGDVDTVHRLPAKQGKVPGVLVRFTSQKLRDQWFLKGKSLRTSDSEVSIVENLTRLNRTLLDSAKKWADANAYKYAWHRNNKVLVRKAHGELAHVIRCDDDLRGLLQ